MHVFIQYMVYLVILHKVNICNKTAEKTYFKAKAWKQAQSKYNFKLHMPFYGLIQQFKNLD